ncbi:arylalkylamine N-acetyltransferase-like 2 isoform X2 [Periplaneta americana]|uniref:arylalkylamine N-acetyltransferase-like 2 isoform X2 n=1 Tax=Periplaneta americana TaxID=6978 RepID=UPI0037E7A10C
MSLITQRLSRHLSVGQWPRKTRVKMTGSRWTRPGDIPFPTVWRWYNGKQPLEGKTPRFRIQDVTEDLEDEVVQHMTDVFLRDEPMCSSVGLADDPVSVLEFQTMWRDYMRQRVALVAVVEPETTPYSGHRVAGCNLLGITCRGDVTDINKYKGVAFRKLIEALDHTTKMAKLFERYGVDYYLCALGLSVAREYRGQGLGFELLKARFDLGRAMGLPLTVTLFSPASTQWMGAQLGMKTVVEIDYEDYKDDEGHVVFSGIENKSMKLMAGKI